MRYWGYRESRQVGLAKSRRVAGECRGGCAPFAAGVWGFLPQKYTVRGGGWEEDPFISRVTNDQQADEIMRCAEGQSPGACHPLASWPGFSLTNNETSPAVRPSSISVAIAILIPSAGGGLAG